MRRGSGHTLRDVLIEIHNHVGHHVVCGYVDVKFHEILHGDMLSLLINCSNTIVIDRILISHEQMGEKFQSLYISLNFRKSLTY
jgi:hypothetical protein